MFFACACYISTSFYVQKKNSISAVLPTIPLINFSILLYINFLSLSNPLISTFVVFPLFSAFYFIFLLLIVGKHDNIIPVGGMLNMYNNLTQFEMLTLQQEKNNFYLAIVVALITLLSAVGVYLDYRHRKNKERAEKSIGIAEEFAKNIIEPLSVLYVAFKKYEIDKLVNKINFMRFIDFDNDELISLYSSNDIEQYHHLMNTCDPDGKLHSIICDTLNNLEYMCMYISTKVADEKYIYNSLHQQFLKSIALLYFEISTINIDNKNKYYTNIIHVYNLWKNKYIDAEKRELKLKKKESKLVEKQKKLKKKLLPASPKI